MPCTDDQIPILTKHKRAKTLSIHSILSVPLTILTLGEPPYLQNLILICHFGDRNKPWEILSTNQP